MTANFGHLKKHDVDASKTTTYTLYQLDGAPVLTCRVASEANKPFHQALIIDTMKNKHANKRMNAQRVAIARKESRARDRVLFAKHVIVGWEGVLDSDGKPVEFSSDNVAAFMQSLPDWIFDELHSFCEEPSNFIPEALSDADIKIAAGN